MFNIPENNPDQMFDEPPPKPSNPLGLIGLVLSVCVSPLGLLVSLIALTRKPRGAAIAGVIVGLVGSVVWLFVAFALIAAVRLGAMDAYSVVVDFTEVQKAIKGQTPAGAAPPDDLGSLGLAQDVLTDPWGKAYVYSIKPDGSGWTFTTFGKDGQPGTFDDIELEGAMTMNEINDTLQQYFRRVADPKNAPRAAPPPQSTPAPAPAPAEQPAPAESTAPKSQ